PDARRRGGRPDRAGVDRLLVALRALARAAVRARRGGRGRPLVALPRSRAKSLRAARRLRLGFCDDLSRPVPHRGGPSSDGLRACARHSLAPVAAPARARRRRGRGERRGARAVRLDLARPARLDRLGAPARAAELPPGAALGGPPPPPPAAPRA